MRDDIHKGAPVPRRWQLVLKHCARSADWEVEAPLRARDALVRDLRGHVSNLFLHEVSAEVLGRGQLSLLRGIDVHRLLLFARSPVEQLFVRHLAVVDRLRVAAVRQEILRETWSRTLQEIKAASRRSLEQHVLETQPGAIREAHLRLVTAMGDHHDDLVDTLCRGQLPAAPQTTHSELDFDNLDLR